MKYVMMMDQHGKRYPFMFPESVVHDDMSRYMVQLVRSNTRNKIHLTCVSAGFVAGLSLDMVTHGNSESLGLDSHPMDAAYIALGDAVAMMPVEMMPGLMARAREHFKS